MRSIVNISLPKSMLDDVEEAVQEGGFASKSEFFRKLVRDWREDREIHQLQKSHNEIADGKGIVLKSLKDLR